MDIPEKFGLAKLMAPYVPFIGAAVKQADGRVNTPLPTRLIEAALIGGVVLYGTVQLLGEKINSTNLIMNVVKEQLKEVKTSQSILQKDIVELKVDVATIKEKQK